MSARLVLEVDDTLSVDEAGGKAVAIARLRRAGLPAPGGLVVTTSAYREFTAHGGLRERIALELARRPLSDLRLEETWDVALRIRSMFMGAEWPHALAEEVRSALQPIGEGTAVVRSSAPHEDAVRSSFAGLHESIIGVRGVDELLGAVRSVWASLFTDRALLYHRELGLDASRSTMAVLVQPLTPARCAGVAFSRSPDDASHSTVEAVWGLGEGLVSGRIEPDLWVLDRHSGSILDHRPAPRAAALIDRGHGLAEESLDEFRRRHAPLDADEVAQVWEIATRAERLFRVEQDCEWLFTPGAELVLTQARPITVRPADDRAAYLDAQGSADRLETLRALVEDELLPAIEASAAEFAAVDLTAVTDEELARQAALRAAAVERWRAEYRSTMIPLAHGARLLGRLYTDTLAPDDPFDYLQLLVRTAEEYATHSRLLAELGSTALPPAPRSERRAAAEQRFLGAFGSEEARVSARRLLDLARASWRLRDDDNLYVGLAEREATRALIEIRHRLAAAQSAELDAARRSLEALDESTLDSDAPEPVALQPGVRPRQLLGQPAGPGVGTGRARVIHGGADLKALESGDIVVADALEPDTAAYAARAAGIVERRGGMLVHGAIVAREHGIPCVTGVTGATALIREGERVTVDGYLGIVVLNDV